MLFRSLTMTAHDHDYTTAVISHLPHVIAATLVNAVKKLADPEPHMKLIAAGGIDSVQLNIRKIVENALRCGASSVVVAHNHPSGVALPSPDDNAATLSAFDALRTVSVELVDHIIVADDDFVSLRHNGLLPERKGEGYGI